MAQSDRLREAARQFAWAEREYRGEPDPDNDLFTAFTEAETALLAFLSTPPPSDLTFPHRGSWRHAGWCEFERGSETVCSCGLDDARRTLIGAPHDPE